MKTSELKAEDGTLDWAVWSALGLPATYLDHNGHAANFSTQWAQGGPIIQREECIATLERLNGGHWRVQTPYDTTQDRPGAYYYGSTPLVAAMRCYVASKLGDEVEIPEELK